MSKREKRTFIKKLLMQGVEVKGINCKVRLKDMFSRFNNVAIVIRGKQGNYTAIGL